MTTPNYPEHNSTPPPTPFPTSPAPYPAFPQGNNAGAPSPAPFSNPLNPTDPYKAATMGRRLAAYLLDCLIVWIPSFILLFIVAYASLPSVTFSEDFTDEDLVALNVDDFMSTSTLFVTGAAVIVLLGWLYWLGFDAITGQTLGKKALKLRVIRYDDTSTLPSQAGGIGWGNAILRRLYIFLPLIPYVGGWAAFGVMVGLGVTGSNAPDSRTFLDKAAKARVIDLR